jgi:GT2 family glycosyltransferase
MRLSVIICTHNPRQDYLTRVLQALREQTLPITEWELLLVDNCSSKPLTCFDLSWHTNAIYIREDTLGLTPARLCGITHARGEILVFVDDDNLLCPLYLETCLTIAAKFNFLGVWGGQQLSELEIVPPPFLLPFVSTYLACRRCDRVTWTNSFFADVMPVGAGMCVRLNIALLYKAHVEGNNISSRLGRKGDLLTSGDDYDLAFTACDHGLGMGVFPELTLTHIIPATRLQPTYILRLLEGNSYSLTLLRHSRGLPVVTANRGVIWKSLRLLYRVARGQQFQMRAQAARERGIKRALKSLEHCDSQITPTACNLEKTPR